MVTTPMFGITEHEKNGANAHALANSAYKSIENATQRDQTLTITGNRTLTAAEFQGNFWHVLTGTPAAFELTVPAQDRFFGVENLTAVTATIKSAGAGNSIELLAGERRLLVTDGIDVRAAEAQLAFIAGFISGLATSNQVMLRFLAPFDFVIRAGAPDSQATVGTPPADGIPPQAVFTLAKNGGAFGDVTFDENGDPTFNVASDTAFVRGTDVLEIGAPFTADSALADINITLAALRAG